MENSRIEWTDHTFNPWVGCTKVSPGCQHCYAEVLMDKRFGRVQWGPQGERLRTSAANWRKPLSWNDDAGAFVQCNQCGWRGDKRGKSACPACGNSGCHPVRQRVFCASLADVFEDRPELRPWREDLFRLIEQTPALDWLLLTKRPQHVFHFVPRDWLSGFPPNVWMGASVENQETADRRIPNLIQIPARVLFLSVEPLLNAVDLSEWLFPDKNHDCLGVLNWVIVGGESGPEARPMHPDWVRRLCVQCLRAEVPFFFKQWGRFRPAEYRDPEVPRPPRRGKWRYRSGHWPDNYGRRALGHAEEAACMVPVGKREAGRLLDGREWSQFPNVKQATGNIQRKTREAGDES